MLTAEVIESDGHKSLNGIVRMPLDADILCVREPPGAVYKQEEFRLMREKYSLAEIRRWCIDQAKRQIILFSSLLRDEAYTRKELEVKIQPYFNTQIVSATYFKAMRRPAKVGHTVRGEHELCNSASAFT